MNTTVKGVPAALVPGGLNRTQTNAPQARPAAPARAFTAPGNLQPMQANRSPSALAQQHPALMPPRSHSLPPRPGGLDPTSRHAAFNPFAGALRQQHPPAMPMPAANGYPGVSWASMPQPPHASPYAAMPTPQPYRPQPPLQAPNPFAGATGPGRFGHGQAPFHQAGAPTYAAPPGYAAPPRRHSAPAGASSAARPHAAPAQAEPPQAGAQKEKFSFTKALFMSGYLSERYGWSSGGGSRISARMSRYNENHSGPGTGSVEHHSF